MSIIPSVMWTFSFVFLLDGLRRIRNVMRNVIRVKIIYPVFYFYAAIALIAIIG